MQTDGRNIDLEIGSLVGEAALVKVKRPEVAAPPAPTEIAAGYHGEPLLQKPVWTWMIPTYFAIGGAAGAASALGAAAQFGGRELEPLVEKCRAIAAAGTVVSAGLLIADLGRPERFFNMLRVFRKTSPMSVGSWILAGAGATTVAAVGLPLVGQQRAASIAGAAAGVFGLGLAGYTGVLLAGTAVPAWQLARRPLPPLFVASGIAAAAGILELMPLNARERKVVRVFGTAGKALELVLERRTEKSLESSPTAQRALRRSPLWKTGAILTGASLLLGLTRHRELAGALAIGGALAMKFGVTNAGTRSTIDPRAALEAG